MNLKPKTKKVLKIVLNVVVYVVFALVLLVTILVISSGKKGYTSLFGTAFVAVESDSMDGNRDDSFQKGALLKVKILEGEEKLALKEGEIISFYDLIDGKRVINSHRIVAVWGEGENTVFRTQGDKEGAPVDTTSRTLEDVIGKVTGSSNGVGNFFLFLRSSTGFVICVLVPCLLLIAYCVYDLVRIVLEQKKKEKADNKELLKQQLLEELRAEGKIPAAETVPVAESAEQPEKAPVTESAPAAESSTLEKPAENKD